MGDFRSQSKTEQVVSGAVLLDARDHYRSVASDLALPLLEASQQRLRTLSYAYFPWTRGGIRFSQRVSHAWLDCLAPTSKNVRGKLESISRMRVVRVCQRLALSSFSKRRPDGSVVRAQYKCRKHVTKGTGEVRCPAASASTVTTSYSLGENLVLNPKNGRDSGKFHY